MTGGSGDGTQGELLSQGKLQDEGVLMSAGKQVHVYTTGKPIERPRPYAQGESSAPTWYETPCSTRTPLDSTDMPPFDFPITVPLEIEHP